LIQTPYSMVVGQSLNRENGWRTGDFITLTHAGRQVIFRNLGTLALKGLALIEGGRVAIVDIATFQEFTGLAGLVDRIDLQLHNPRDPQALEQIRALLPEELDLVPPSERREGGQGLIRAYQSNLSILSFASLFVGMFLVYSLVAFNAASRRHELAVLRSVGASARMLFMLFLAEGFLLGLVGWGLAIPISFVCVPYLLQSVSQTISTLFVPVGLAQLTIDGWEVVVSFGTTVLIAVLAAYQPARETMCVAPKEAMAMAHAGGRPPQTLDRLARKGAVLLLLVWPMSQIPGLPGVPWPAYLAAILLFIGFALITPWGLRQAGRFLPGFLRRVAGEPAYLAGRYMRDSGPRTAISIGALITAVALFTALVVMVHSFRSTVEHWVKQSVRGDIFLQPRLAARNLYHTVLPPGTIKLVKNLEADVDAVGYRRIMLKHDGIPFHFEAIDIDGFRRYGDFFWLTGKPIEALTQLAQGQGVVVSQVFANQTGLGTGDMFRARIGKAVIAAPILGIARDYRTRGGVVFYALQAYQHTSDDRGLTGLRLFIQDRPEDWSATTDRLVRELRMRCGTAVEVVRGDHLRRTVLKIFDETFAVTTVLLLIALLIAALGITTTLTVLVLERSRELNTLLAIGASMLQVRIMIIWEALLMVVAGGAAGMVCGFGLAYLLVFVINLRSFGWTFIFQVDWPALVQALPLIAATAVMASWPAVRVAFRQPPASVLRE
jgi:putative ABC transport system permease protein